MDAKLQILYIIIFSFFITVYRNGIVIRKPCNFVSILLNLRPPNQNMMLLKTLYRSVLLIIVLLPLAPLSFGGDHSSAVVHRKRVRDYSDEWDFDRRFALKLTPTSLLDPYGALLPLGVEYYSSSRLGFGLDLGFPLFYVLNNRRFDYDKRLKFDFKIRMELRRYFRLREKSRLFYGAELYYRYQKMILHNSYFHFIDNTCYSFAEAEAVKNNFGTGFMFGAVRKPSDRLSLEAWLGAGVRLIYMSPRTDLSGNPTFFKGSFVSLEPPNEDRVGDHDLNIYVPFGIKLSYLF